MSALGYREIAAHLAGVLSLEDALEQTKISTHQFIRRQEIWFRGHDNGILWHNGSTMNVPKLLGSLATWKQE
jgi:tRNA dimethylallyltransferase